MTPEEMSRIHGAAFVHERGWSAAEFEQMLAQPYIQHFSTVGGFALTRTLAGESELLTLAVAPEHQRRGIARTLLMQWLKNSAPLADTAFLDVAADNNAALKLYDSLLFQRINLRKGYYTRKGGPAVDAILMSRDLTQG
jgi:ribosomal-protein-alanine N-acetyltransferase